jgi:hypothetical protein
MNDDDAGRELEGRERSICIWRARLQKKKLMQKGRLMTDLDCLSAQKKSVRPLGQASDAAAKAPNWFQAVAEPIFDRLV